MKRRREAAEPSRASSGRMPQPPKSAEREPAQRLGPTRTVIARVEPQVDGGLYPVKRVAGEWLEVRAVAFAEGHDRLRGLLLHRRAGEGRWTEEPLERLPNDAWSGGFRVGAPGREEYTVEVWTDAFTTWREGLAKKLDAGLDVVLELREGAPLVGEAAGRARGGDAEWLRDAAGVLGAAAEGTDAALGIARGEKLAALMSRHPDRGRATRHALLAGEGERERARSGAWYEFFPRSCAPEPGGHGSLRDCESRLDHAARMGFDVVYLPPLHPIGRSHRKGPDNDPQAGPDDVGSPWAIGAAEGGHTAIHPDLGSLEDFDRFVESARRRDLEVAIDLAFQCSPDHPWVKEHPEWFRRRPDGSIHYAENPPKKYQDIYPFEFECEDWQGLWNALRDVVRFWLHRGVSIFRVDNPHTKPFAFWEWLIREIRSERPDTVWLSEAFTRPAVLQHLAKIGFSQSYTYFTWRNRRRELEDYVRELWSPPLCEYLRPNFFANTPDILHAYLQTGGRPAFLIRLVLAATLSDSYGIYGPPFELCVGDALPGSEEYRASEKYEVRHWNLDDPESIAPTVERINRIRREHEALHLGSPPILCEVDNEELIAYLRRPRGEGHALLVVANLDPHHTQSGWVEVPAELLDLRPGESFQAEDLLGGARYLWVAGRNYVSLDPGAMPAHVLRIRQRVRSENDFDYFL